MAIPPRGSCSRAAACGQVFLVAALVLGCEFHPSNPPAGAISESERPPEPLAHAGPENHPGPGQGADRASGTAGREANGSAVGRPEAPASLPAAENESETALRLLDRFAADMFARPGGGGAVTRIAWLLATHPDSRARDGRLALHLARAACAASGDRDPRALDALAAAAAENRDWNAARDALTRARRVAEAASDPAFLGELSERFNQYDSKQAHRSSGWPVFEPAAAGGSRERHALAYAAAVLAVESAAERPDASLLLLGAALRFDPECRFARRHLGQALLEAGDFVQAVGQLVVVAADGAPDAALLADLGRALQGAGLSTAAMEAFRKALALEPNHPAAANNLAWLMATHPAEKLRNGAEALRRCESLLANAGDARAAILDTQAAALAELGRFAEAQAASTEAIRLAEAAGRLAEARDYRERLELYRSGRPFRVRTTSALSARFDEHGASLAAGRRLLREGRVDEALAQFEAALGEELNDPGILNDLGVALLDRRRYAPAALALARAVRLAPQSTTALQNLAWLRAASGDLRLRDPGEALVLIEEALAQSPPNWSLFDAAGVAYAAVGRFEEAAQAAESAEKLARDAEQTATPESIALRRAIYLQDKAFLEPPSPQSDPPAAVAQALSELAALALEQGRPHSAQRTLEAATRLVGNDAALWGRLGQAAWQAGNPEAAIAAYRRALALKPEAIAEQNNLAWALAAQPAPAPAAAQEAVRLAEAVVAAAGDSVDASAWDTLAVAQAATGDFEKAAATADRALKGLLEAAPLEGPITARRELFRRRQAYVEEPLAALDIPPAARPMQVRLGQQALRDERWGEAVLHFRTALRLREDLQSLTDLGEALRRLGRGDEGIEFHRRALERNPRFLPAANNLSWALATRPRAASDETLEAIAWAERACQATRFLDPAALDTLAVASAAAGKFDEALAYGERALELAQNRGLERLGAAIRMRLDRFRKREPYHEQPVSKAAYSPPTP